MSIIIAPIEAAAADTAARTITGVAALYGVPANASTGRVQFEPGSIILPDDLSRVKLCLDHDHRSAIGYAIAAEDDTSQLVMTFHIPEGKTGDEALDSAAKGIRDGLSVGAYPDPDGVRFVNGTRTSHITRAQLREVSLVAVPAFDAARVEHVNAQATITQEDPMPKTTTETPETPQAGASETVENAAMQAPPIITPKAEAPETVEAAARLVAMMTMDGAPLSQIRAALSDVTPTSDAGTAFIGRETWLGQLWKASRVTRPLIDSLTRKPLGRTTKVKGWQWETKPTVDTYTGSKTDIPSNKVKTKAIEADVKRIAGGWDIDRIFVDLGDPDMIQALWEGAVEDYALKTEKAVTDALVDGATKIDTANALPKALVALGTKAAGQGSAVNFVAFGAEVWAAFTALTRDEIPWWMTGSDSVNLSTATGTVNGLRLFVDPSLTATTILAGDSRAATFYEAAPPIRVNAVDLPKGGVDLGLFGYHGLLINDPASIFKIEAAG